MKMHNISYDSTKTYKRQFVKVTIKLKHFLNVCSPNKDDQRLGTD